MDLKELVRKKIHKSLYNNAFSRAKYTLWGTVIREIQVAFRQFYTSKYPIRSFLRTITILNSALLRLILGRSLKYSFAFFGEDRIIEGILKPIVYKDGFYVDVGCNHPKFHSNTYGLYRKGWRGICIDANENLRKKYTYFRLADTFVHTLVSNNIEEREFYRVENDVLSTTENSNLNGIIEEGLTYTKQILKTSTLTSILDNQFVPKKFDLLTIDAEEHDYNVLISLDLTVYRPRLIVIENESFDFNNFTDDTTNIYLTNKNYKLIGYVLKNAYYLDME